MKRRQTSNDFNTADCIELRRKTAIHEAGHAVAVYIGNKQKQLPPVFFQIIINDCSCLSYNNCMTRIEGGRLIHTLPASIEQASRDLSSAQQHAYQQAFEADIINLLVGSLAEAYYVAQRDNELINPHLVPLNALRNYGGTSDLEIVDEYLECFIADPQQQHTKLAELFRSAFEFVNDWVNWSAITALANHIVQNHKSIIDYAEVAAVLDDHFLTTRTRVALHSC